MDRYLPDYEDKALDLVLEQAGLFAVKEGT